MPQHPSRKKLGLFEQKKGLAEYQNSLHDHLLPEPKRNFPSFLSCQKTERHEYITSRAAFSRGILWDDGVVPTTLNGWRLMWPR